jgi:hypothetical protein
MDLLKQARAIGAGVPREHWGVAEFQTQIDKKAAHIQELRRRGYDWSSVFSGESGNASTFERALHEEVAHSMSKYHMPSHEAEMCVPLEALGYGVRAALPSDSVTGGLLLVATWLKRKFFRLVPLVRFCRYLACFEPALRLSRPTGIIS